MKFWFSINAAKNGPPQRQSPSPAEADFPLPACAQPNPSVLLSYQGASIRSTQLAGGDFGEGFGSHNRISKRNWPKNRSYRKQTIKPGLTGTRIAFSDSLHFAQFLRLLREAVVSVESFFTVLRTSRPFLAAFLL